MRGSEVSEEVVSLRAVTGLRLTETTDTPAPCPVPFAHVILVVSRCQVPTHDQGLAGQVLLYMWTGVFLSPLGHHLAFIYSSVPSSRAHSSYRRCPFDLVALPGMGHWTGLSSNQALA